MNLSPYFDLEQLLESNDKDSVSGSVESYHNDCSDTDSDETIEVNDLDGYAIKSLRKIVSTFLRCI